MLIVISSAHGLHVRGASDFIDEVDEARAVVDRVAELLRQVGVEVTTFHDDVSKSQIENLERIVEFHNTQARDLDVSVHFNAYQHTDKPMGTECLYVSQQKLAATIASNIADASGLIDRGAKHRPDLFFLVETTQPAVLIEVCFVDSSADTSIYSDSFDDICGAIAEALANGTIPAQPNPPRESASPPSRPSEPSVDRPSVEIEITATGPVTVTVNGLTITLPDA